MKEKKTLFQWLRRTIAAIDAATSMLRDTVDENAGDSPTEAEILLKDLDDIGERLLENVPDAIDELRMVLLDCKDAVTDEGLRRRIDAAMFFVQEKHVNPPGTSDDLEELAP